MRPIPRSARAKDRLHVLTDEVVPPRRPVVARDKLEGGPGPLFLSYGNVDLVCGGCAFTLVVGAPSPAALRDAVLVCPLCDALNETWDAHALTSGNASECRGVHGC